MFRRKLLTLFALTVFLSVAAVAWLVSAVTRRAFDRSENERTAALVTQFRREFNRQGEAVARRVEAIAASEAAKRMATALNRAAADPGPYFELAKTTADDSQLDFLEFVESNGTIISSAQSPAKFGHPDNAFGSLPSEADHGAFLKQEELQDASALGLFAVAATHIGDHPIYVIGGRRLDRSFLAALDMPAGTRALLYQNRGDRFSPEFLVDPSAESKESLRPVEKLEPLVDVVRRSEEETTRLVRWSGNEVEDEVFHAIPLLGAGTGKDRPLLAILLIGNSRRTYVELLRRIGSAALIVGSGGILIAILVSSWAAARVTRPVEQLAHAAREVALGNWNARVDVLGDDELGQLADSFNRMTTELLGQKERLLQAERVAAWRELARRLAHELKNPLFPLQLTVENLIRARQQTPEQFDEVFRESSRTLLAEISNLKGIIERFSEFSRMPQPQFRRVQVNELIMGVIQLFQAQLKAPGHAKINCDVRLDPHLAPVEADADLLHRAILNLVLNAQEAMPRGGVLSLRTRNDDSNVIIEVADTGIGLTPEESARIFTPYYTSKQQGSGLGLAIVQSVVSDHGGRIRVQSEPERGTTFVIELPRDAEHGRRSG
ncbi:MAG: periplasmic sensor signal transduction histidine kinase [Candidatus Sulfotelmatobacter sp.]|nr:periplasmic sensor signal transduction histidine kinase [Candidatus Sulfotelmatobacter sp.]